MTITLLAPDGVPITAMQERQARAAGHGGGSGRQLGGRSGFRVGTPGTGPDAVLTATSTTWTLKPCSAMIDPGASTHQGMYGWATDANVTGAVTAADGTNPRKDIVYIQVNDSSAGDGSGATDAPVLYLAGTPGVSPAAPALPDRSFLVGTITVPQVGGGSPSVVLNPARYVAAGGLLPVASSAERDALIKYDGLRVLRLDLAGRPDETWDGAAWAPGYREQAADVVTFGTGWSATSGHAPRLRRIGNMVHLVGAVTIAAGASFDNILTIPTAFRPTTTATIFVGANVSSNAAVVQLAIANGLLLGPSAYRTLGLTTGAVLPVIASWPIS